jgi:hypothetical protein
MRKGTQDFLYEMWEAACYALCIIQMAEDRIMKNIDMLGAIEDAIDAGYIYFNRANHADNNNFFVKDPAAFLSLLTNEKWTVRHEPSSYVPTAKELVVERWERRRTGQTIGHFKLPYWDSLDDSQTVKYGTLVSYRVFKCV